MTLRGWVRHGTIIGAVVGVGAYLLGVALSARTDGEALEGVALLLTQYTQPLSTVAWWIGEGVPFLGFVLLFLVVPAAWGAIVATAGFAVFRLVSRRRLTSA